MEPSGRNQWQPVANRKTRKRRNQAKPVATGCDQSPWDLDGKEGVDGSSPSEGSVRVPQIGDLSLGLTCTSLELWLTHLL
jgi:hypothetical protein